MGVETKEDDNALTTVDMVLTEEEKPYEISNENATKMGNDQQMEIDQKSNTDGEEEIEAESNSDDQVQAVQDGGEDEDDENISSMSDEVDVVTNIPEAVIAESTAVNRSVEKMQTDADATFDGKVAEEGISPTKSLLDCVESENSMDHGIEVDDEGMMIREEIPDFRAQEEAAIVDKPSPVSRQITRSDSNETSNTVLSATMEHIQDGLSKLCVANPLEETNKEKNLLEAWSLAPSEPKDIYGTLDSKRSTSSSNLAKAAVGTESSEDKVKDNDGGTSSCDAADSELLRGWSHEEENEKKEPTVTDMIRKAGVAVTGGALVVAGLPMIPMPTPGGVVVVGSGMALLATEFPAAQRAIEKSKEGLSNMVGDESDEEVDEETLKTREKASKIADLIFPDEEEKKAAEKKRQKQAIVAASANNNDAIFNLEELDDMKRKAAKAAQGTKRGLKKFIRGTVLPLMDKMTPGDAKKSSPSKEMKKSSPSKTFESSIKPSRLRLGSKDMDRGKKL
eukprot:CAMPEP_0204626034 /NCGR_PEP_ID=MMETSP0717-20131115/11608_1 /ASSEMBLY_ACC=CAM_ASM_000666 /TAXON_ID=230516 /ORGANISM="Chaetoceros curvisetus" /LENGTH=507 /DNA_ID=CAMNT_0051641843 /DNA_START=49 /DNA_END=1572 /DNA_ORIENTATION=-